MNRKRWILIGISLVILIWIGIRFSRRAIVTGDIVVAVLEGPFRAELSLIGEVRAVNTTNITPRTHGKIADLVPEGTIVEKDQAICWLETEDLERDVDRIRINLEIAEKKLLKAEENARLQDRLNLLAVEESRSRLEYQENQLAVAQSRLEKTRRLVEADISPRKALEDAELDVLSQNLQVQNAALALEKALKNRESQRELQKADVTTASIEVDKSRAELNKALASLNEAVIRAPTSGMVLYKNLWKGGGNTEKTAIGDTIGPWQPCLEIPDLSKLEVVAFVDEVDISRVQEGQPALISLDAFPGLTLNGRMNQIASLAENAGAQRETRSGESGSSRKVFEVGIGITDNPEDLRPGITARVSVLLYTSDHEIYVPIESVFTEGDDRIVYVAGFGGPEKTSVQTGIWNAQYVTIREGLQAGQRIWLTRPDAL